MEKNDPQELDQGYRYVVEVLLNLNHDRFKSYFNYFIILHLGIVTAMLTNYVDQKLGIRLPLAIIGLLLSLCWLWVLGLIRKDITRAWSQIEYYETIHPYKQEIKLSKVRRTDRCISFSASFVMLAIPIAFLFFYAYVLVIEFC